MPADEGRPPWENTGADDEDDPPPLSPLWWDPHDNHSGPELSSLHPLGLNDEIPAKSDQHPPAPIEAPPVVDEEFQQRVNAAYETLPPTIRALPDFPPIAILDEPPNPVSGREILGRFFGVPRSKKVQWISPVTPTVIHVYRGPVLRYAGNQIDAVLKTVVWHEVAHWLGFTTEQEVAELGLSGPL